MTNMEMRKIDNRKMMMVMRSSKIMKNNMRYQTIRMAGDSSSSLRYQTIRRMTGDSSLQMINDNNDIYCLFIKEKEMNIYLIKTWETTHVGIK